MKKIARLPRRFLNQIKIRIRNKTTTTTTHTHKIVGFLNFYSYFYLITYIILCVCSDEILYSFLFDYVQCLCVTVCVCPDKAN